MKAKELAEILNGRQYRSEITRDENIEAKENGLIIITGYSDDNIELGGALCDEVGAYNGTEFYIKGNYIIDRNTLDFDIDNLDNFSGYVRELVKKDLNNSKIIKAEYDINGYTWYISTELEHETFDIMEDGDKFCRGIIVDINNL